MNCGCRLFYGIDVIDGLKTLQTESVHCVVTSPPYWGLRDYGTDGQIGLEKTPEEFVQKMVEVFREVRRVMTKDGTLWLNLGDSYYNYRGKNNRRSDKDLTKRNTLTKPHHNIDARPNEMKISGFKNKDLMGIPWKVAFALRDSGWYLRQDIIWHKPNPMPESVKDRCTKAHEYVFLFSKSERYFFDNEAIKEVSIYKRPPAVPVGWDTGTGSHRSLKGRYRNSAPKGSFNGKTEAMAGTGQNAFRAIVETKNKRSVWTVATKPYAGAHFATFPPQLIMPMIQAGCPQGGVVLDPFGGSGTTAQVALSLGRKAILIDINKKYEPLAMERIKGAL